jgi:hypothetical protein
VDPLVAAMLAMLRAEAVKIGAGLIDKGVDLVQRRLSGEPSDAEVLQWIREMQGAR